ncbi:dihydrolipoamide succinyltransferase component of 2-oxoglutaratedehydrogenase complex (plasmid) [Sinorhizobium fredii NGR234]|uniref:Dihydrolipoamide acetyltransferase component of pyruvate dehydrogenase complex n=1 Tax=Sinorhizobium fredii (strain NBRC 101917 / NGR234) TaxID=394 RepID=C3KR89_SINFN|nr:2-oxo acid dehydrogenase subunit E2 [Sinorhizobium fredii]ACP22597.1 dihydrolipoamide succinyltransferase component of 2-oxoglutaratedehydrogenase complex [Sinorhizobium fredii NGR234]
MGDLIDINAPVEQEGTKAIVRNWLKKIGESVKSGDPLVELETDKVTQEVPAPADGFLSEILMENGDDALPGAILGRIGSEPPGHEQPDMPAQMDALKTSTGSSPPPHFSPAVRRAAEEYGIDPTTIAGTGRDGRVTRADMDRAFAEAPGRAAPAPEPKPTEPPPSSRPMEPADAGAALRSRKIAHSGMRTAIATHMLQSVTTAPHVTAVFEADFSAIMRHRDAHKAKPAAEGSPLSYTAYIVSACVAAMRAVPNVNSRWHDDALEVFDDINIGVGIALGDKGLIVPVIHQAQHLSLAAIAAKLQDMTARARSNALGPAEVRGGTFTISNHGVSGSLFAAPIIINQPQSAILGVGKLEKRVVVREVDGVDTIQIRPMAYVSLTIDHRALDGHQTNMWLTHFVQALENWPK